MGLSYLTPPVCEPLHVADVRQHVKQDITDDDSLIMAYLGAARTFAEEYCRKQFVAARFVYKMDSFPANYAGGLNLGYGQATPGNAIELPKAPLIEVESIDYLDTTGAQRTVSPADYIIDSTSEPARITPVFGKIWPINIPQIGSVWVTYKAGYIGAASFDAAADTVTVKHWRTLAAGDIIRLSNSGGALPAALAVKTDYYIESVVSAGNYKLAASAGGTAINLADVGTGQHFLGQPGISIAPGELPYTIKAWMLARCDTHYAHRGEMANTRGGEITPLPYIDRLLDNDRLWN